MRDASSYPVTFGYGAQDGIYYYTPTPTHPKTADWVSVYHRGDDRAMPIETPVVVNGVEIGTSGARYGGAHLHTGRFVNGADTNPQGGGFTLEDATVFDTGYDDVNGNFIRVTSKGVLYVYLHLSSILVTKGQILKGDDLSDIADHDFVADACVLGMNLQPETNQVFLNNIGLPKSQVLKNILGYSESRNLRLRAESYEPDQARIKELEAQIGVEPTKLVKGVYSVQ